MRNTKKKSHLYHHFFKNDPPLSDRFADRTDHRVTRKKSVNDARSKQEAKRQTEDIRRDIVESLFTDKTCCCFLRKRQTITQEHNPYN